MAAKWRQALKRPLASVLAVLCLTWVIPVMHSHAMEMSPGSLVVEIASGQSEWQEDIEAAGAVLDLYQIAKAENYTPADAGFRFVLNDAFSRVDLDEEAYAIAADAAEIAKGSVDPVVSGKKLEETVSVDPGLYLLVVHGNDPVNKSDYFQAGEDGIYTVVSGEKNEYRFAPQLISIPTKEGSDTPTTADTSEWVGTEDNPLTVFLKVSIPPLPCHLDPPVKKVVTGDAAPKDDVYTFVMIPEDPKAPMPENDEARKGSNGSLFVDHIGPGEFEFGRMTFDENDVGETYVYKISEVKGKDPHYTYDVQIYTLTVVVTMEERQVVIDATYTDANDKEIETATFEFTNVYEKEKKTPSPRPKTGDGSKTTQWAGLMLISLAGLIATMTMARKESKDQNTDM